jgi:SanA protein
MKRILKLVKRIFFLGVTGIVLTILFAWGVNSYILSCTNSAIKKSVSNTESAYTGIVLGSLVFGDHRISQTVAFRCDKAIELYKKGKIKRILVSGDHGQKDYDEVNAMKNYLVKMGIPEKDIFMDHAGFNTYDTMIRAKKVFEVDDAIIVSQDFHLARSVYIAQHAGLNAQAIAAKDSKYLNLSWITRREQLARVKSFLEVVINRDPKYLGEAIPITGKSSASFD